MEIFTPLYLSSRPICSNAGLSSAKVRRRDAKVGTARRKWRAVAGRVWEEGGVEEGGADEEGGMGFEVETDGGEEGTSG